MIVAPHSAQLAAFHWVVKFTHVGDGGCSKRISKSSMISLPVIVVHILCGRVPNRLSSIAGQLRHPLTVWMRGDASDVYGPLEAMSINNKMHA
jgi:hypothetical protein